MSALAGGAQVGAFQVHAEDVRAGRVGAHGFGDRVLAALPLVLAGTELVEVEARVLPERAGPPEAPEIPGG